MPHIYTLCTSGITIFGLEDPLVLRQSATVSCMTDLPVSYIEWRNQSSQLSVTTSDDTPDLTVLEYTIAYVSEGMRGELLTCVVIARDQTPYFKAAEIMIKGLKNSRCVVCAYSCRL